MTYHRSVFHHRLGDDPGARTASCSATGATASDWPGVDLSPDGRWLAIKVSQGWAKSEIYLLDVARGRRAASPVADGEEALFDVVEVLDDRLYLHDQRRAALPAVRGRSGAAGARALARDHARGGTRSLQDVADVGGGLAVASTCRTPPRACACTRADGAPRGEIALPGLGT